MAHADRIAIIGGGIAGLSAGIYARLNGFRPMVFEAQDRPGGVCASWEQQGYTVNGSFHWLVGSAPGSDLHEMWRELGVVQDAAFLVQDSFAVWHDLAGAPLRFPSRAEALEEEWLALSPEDSGPIGELAAGIRAFAEADLPMKRAFELIGPLDWGGFLLRNIPFVRALLHWRPVTLGAFAARFHHPGLREGLASLWHPGMSMAFLLMQMGHAHKESTGYLLGGSGGFIARLVRRYASLEGELRTSARVTRIATEDGAAIGVETADGAVHGADFVVAACDGHTLTERLLRPEEVSPALRDAFAVLRPFPAIAFFSAGVRDRFAGLPASVMGHNIRLPEPLEVAGHVQSRITVQVHNFDPTLSPPGRTLLTAMVSSGFEPWQALAAQGGEAYAAEKTRIIRAVLAALERWRPGLGALLDFADLATPLTFERWTGNHRGSYEGWLPTPEAQAMTVPTHMDEVRRLYVAGHWVAPGGGMPPAAYTGRNAIQMICRDTNRAFTTRG